jgi:hypothetical protein
MMVVLDVFFAGCVWEHGQIMVKELVVFMLVIVTRLQSKKEW